MENTKYVEYKTERFYLQSSKRYYQSGNKKSHERSLHRRVWSDHHGPIPDGYEVHHKNEDWSDNDIENLECLPMLTHQRQHMKERFDIPGYREQNAAQLKEAQEGAKIWHASPEGLVWHSEQGKRSWDNRISVKLSCTVCGSSYETHRPEVSRFCSKSCSQKESYQRHKTATKNCILCGESFVFNKYREQECCSRVCSNRVRGMRERGIPIVCEAKEKPEAAE